MGFNGLKHKPESNQKRSASMKKLYAENRPEGMGFKRKYYTQEEERTARALANRRRQLRCRYGMELEDYEVLLQKQEGRCAICGAEEAHPGTGYLLHVDHDHISGKVRGLLCSVCNKGLGFLEKAGLEQVAHYLRAWNAFAIMHFEGTEWDDFYDWSAK